MADINWGALLDDSNDAFEVLPVGKYRMKVVKASAAMSSTSKLMFKVVLEVINGPKTGKAVYNNITMTTDNKKALYMFFQNMAALGVTEAYLRQEPRPAPEQVASKMLGAVADVVIDHSVWQGRTRENVKSMTGVSAGSGSVDSSVPDVAAPAESDGPVANPGAPKLPF